jgi:hypothetical protein
MRSLDPTEIKWSKAALLLAGVFAIFLPFYAKTALHSKQDTTKSVTSEALLLGGVVLLFCILGFVAMLRRKRTLLAFAFFIMGFSFTVTFPPLGFAFIIVGGWLLLRAYRIQKFGTPNAKLAAREAAARPPRRQRKQVERAPAKPTGHKPPSANKRYTPKAAPRRKVAKPSE